MGTFRIDEERPESDLPDDITFEWNTTLLNNGKTIYNLFVPDTYINPQDTSQNKTFTQGDFIMLRYFSPVDKAIQINIGDVWKDVDTIQINVGDVWKDVTKMEVNVGDTWKTVF